MLRDERFSKRGIEDRIQEVSESIKRDEVALFCGAGISKNSGLPLANELKKSMLEKLSANEEEIVEIARSKLPFEAFMGIVRFNEDISKVLDVFRGGKPNTNHILIARLARSGHVRVILTTNFDLLIEKAMKKEGMKRGLDFRVFYDEDQFSAVSSGNLDMIRVGVFKIHGSVEDKKSIRTTLDEVASRTLSDKRMDLIRYLFSTGPHKKVLILGYSCSDLFDITPQIQNIDGNRKEVLFVEHSNSERTEDIRTRREKNPFANFAGTRLACDTDQFIERIWNSLKSEIGEYAIRTFETPWRKRIEDWGKALDENKGCLKYFITGSMLYSISDFRKAIACFRKTLEIDKEVEDEVGQAACYGSLGNAYHGLGEFENAVKCFEGSLEIAKRIRDRKKESSSYTNLGTVYFDMGKFNEAIRFHDKSLEIDRTIGDNAGEAASLAGLGNAYQGLGEFDKAIEYHKRSLEISEWLGEKTGETTCYTNLGNAYHGLREFDRAIEYHGRSLKIARQIGDRAMEARCYTNLGIVYFDRGEFDRAIEYHGRSLKIARQIGDRAMEANCFINLGDVYRDLKNLKKAIKLYSRSKAILEKIGQTPLLDIVRNRLVNIYETGRIQEY